MFRDLVTNGGNGRDKPGIIIGRDIVDGGDDIRRLCHTADLIILTGDAQRVASKDRRITGRDGNRPLAQRLIENRRCSHPITGRININTL